MTTIYVYLLEEDVDVWRPVEATQESESIFRLADAPMPEGEVWEFRPRARVRAELRELEHGPVLVAIGLA